MVGRRNGHGGLTMVNTAELRFISPQCTLGKAAVSNQAASGEDGTVYIVAVLLWLLEIGHRTAWALVEWIDRLRVVE